MNTMVPRFTTLATAVTTGLVAMLLTAASAVAQQPPAAVEVGTVTEIDSSPMIRLPGSVLSLRDARIAAELNGRLTWVAEVGDRVARGEPVATIDAHLLDLQLRNDEAQIARIQADIDYNRRQAARLQRLARQNNTAQSELDQTESGLAMLTQELRIAEVTRDRTRYDLERSQVKAPFDGVVAAREMAAGEYTTTGATLVRLVDTEALEISVHAPLRVARFNRAGATADVEADGVQFASTIRGAVPVGDSQSRMMELRLQADPDQLYIGEAVTVSLAESRPQSTLSVPRDALVLRNQETFVYAIDDDDTAVRVPVTAGSGSGADITVSGDLTPGLPVVTRGAERLREGQKVKIIRRDVASS